MKTQKKLEKVRIGVDVGATKIVVGVVDGTKILHKKLVLLSDHPEPASCRKALGAAIAEVSQGKPIGWIGVGCPGPCDYAQGVLVNEFTMPNYYGWNLKADLKEDFEVPVTVLNDVDAALLGEIASGQASRQDSVILLSVGTGVGAAWWNNGSLHSGRGLIHPELSQIPLDSKNPEMVLEDILSGRSIEAQAQKGGYSSASALSEAALQGDPSALAMVEPFIQAAGFVVSVIAHAFCPQTILLSGTTLRSLFPLVQPQIRLRLAAASAVGGASIRVALSALGSDAAVVGAALFADSEISGDKTAFPAARALVPRLFSNHSKMSEAAAEEFIRTVLQKPDALICCATGETPTEMYRLLSDYSQGHPGFFHKVRILGLDEWGGLGKDLSSSCQSYLLKNVLRPLGIEEHCLFDPQTSDPEKECDRVGRWLKTQGPIDLCILGVGKNGHLGLNEPSEAATPRAHRAVLSQQSLKHQMLKGRDLNHLFGMTLGMGNILASSKILCLWAGEGKGEVFQRFLREPPSARLPVTLLRTHPDTLVLADYFSSTVTGA